MAYYDTCAFAKPGNSPAKKKKENGYKDKPNRYCFYTGAPCAERHEVFGGANRQTSINLEFQVDVCPDIHRALQSNSTEWAKKENEKWRKHFQKEYERKLIKQGMTKDEARKAWIVLIGRSYL